MLVTCVALPPCAVTLAARAVASPSAIVLVVVAVLVAEALALDRFSAPVLGSDGPVRVGLMLASIAPLIAVGAHLVLDAVAATHEEVRLVGALAPLAALALLAVLVASWPPPTRWLGVGALLAVGASALLIAGSLVCAAFRPTIDEWVSSIPVVARAPLHVHECDDELGERVTLHRSCYPICTAELVVYENTYGGPTLKRCDDWSPEVSDQRDLVVRHDRARGVWILEGVVYRQPPWWNPRVRLSDPAYRVFEWAEKPVPVRAAGVFSPPRGWIVGAAVGLALSIAFQLRRRRLVARSEAVAAGRAGVLGPSGVVALEGDALPVRVANGQGLSEGPVLVLAAARPAGGAYRGDAVAGESHVVSGGQQELLGRAEALVAQNDARVFAVALITAAPLAGAAIAWIGF